VRDNWKRGVAILTVMLAAQAAAFHSRSRAESVPFAPPLASFPANLGEWQLKQEGVVEKEVKDVLQADDLLTRYYVRPSDPAGSNLFVAYFQSQRTGKAPHSPKNCLPGSGWLPSTSDFLRLPTGSGGEIEVNRYVVSKGEERSVVLYWYQTPQRTVASEYWAKVFLVADSIRYNRSDTAMVRIVTPVVNDDVERATAAASSLALAAYPVMRLHLPE
jgi:EpsI family protein